MKRKYRHVEEQKTPLSAPCRRVLDYARQVGILRPRDLKEAGVPREYLTRLQRDGLLNKVGRGLYCLPDAEIGENHSLVELAKRAPRGVVCLLSALRFHGLTTQSPFEVWLAFGNKDRLPKIPDRQVRFMRFSGASLVQGIQEHSIEGVTVRVYSPAKTVADCFKFRSKIGQAVAIEALRDCLRQRKATAQQIWQAATACRVSSIIKPFLEAML